MHKDYVGADCGCKWKINAFGFENIRHIVWVKSLCSRIRGRFFFFFFF